MKGGDYELGARTMIATAREAVEADRCRADQGGQVSATAPLKDTPKTVRIDVGRIYLGFNHGGFVNTPNDQIEEFADRASLHRWLDAQLDAAERRLEERQGP